MKPKIKITCSIKPMLKERVVLICSIQIFAAGLGVLWGFAVSYGHYYYPEIWDKIKGFDRPYDWGKTASFAIFLIFVDILRLFLFRKRRLDFPVSFIICLALCCLSILIIFTEPFYDFGGDMAFVVMLILLMFIYLIFIGPLVRFRVWFAVSGASLFLATSLAMLIYNGLKTTHGIGYFSQWLS